MIDWLLDRMAQFGDSPALVWRDAVTSYAGLRALIDDWRARLADAGVATGDVVALEGDYSPNACALLIALAERRAVIVPLTTAVAAQREEFLRIAQAGWVTTLDDMDGWRLERVGGAPHHPLLRDLAAADATGLIVFSSGSTGANKAALHDFGRVLEKFRTPRRPLTTLNFLLLDHLGGINTLFHTLANGGTVVVTRRRDPDEICALIARHRVELLPTSPTFLKLLLLSEAYRRHDLSSLTLVTYGTELMPESTLRRLREALPHATLQQTYGLSELGVLRSKSKGSDSLWVKVGGEGVETKVVDGTLWIRTRSAMLGYLNAPSPFDAEGWMNTQDLVEVDGEYVRFLGRRSEIINVGGQKVSPADVESVLLQMDGVRDATVFAQPNPITGHVVAARLVLARPEDPIALKRRVRAFCREQLPPYKVPVRVDVADAGETLHSLRFKTIRRVAAAAAERGPS